MTPLRAVLLLLLCSLVASLVTVHTNSPCVAATVLAHRVAFPDASLLLATNPVRLSFHAATSARLKGEEQQQQEREQRRRRTASAISRQRVRRSR